MKKITILIIMIGFIGCSPKRAVTTQKVKIDNPSTFEIPKEIPVYDGNQKPKNINREIEEKREIEKELKEYDYLKKHGMELDPATQILNIL